MNKPIARSTWRRIASVTVVVLVLAVVGFAALAWHREIEPIEVPARSSFDAGLVQRGQRLASIGNCIGCHTVANGQPFAGGTPLATPFGTVHGSNITPDANEGIGRWSEAAFRRALREGVSREGHLLYPAFPYDHFTHLSDADISALYAFVMTRDPSSSKPPANRMVFPLQFRPLIAGWNLLFLHEGPSASKVDVAESHDAQWQRGAYLVDALAHCAACHTPRNALGAERTTERFAGTLADGWHAPAIGTSSPSPIPWTVDALTSYLHSGLADDHAIAAGPMQGVVQGLSHVPEEEVRAIAVYMQSQMGPTTPERSQREAAARAKASTPSLASPAVETASSSNAAGNDAQLALGAQVYAQACATCHDMGRGPSASAALRLPLAVALQLPDPSNLIHIVREGIRPPDGHVGRWMPSFDGSLDDAQIKALAIWLRQRATDRPAWAEADVEHAIETTRRPSP